ncbi:hypothetical protein KC19_4G210100 [Ceratodon purpureus]|uniref:Protein kinase domain-containing protein n=1 Tax=Ceratodon purpureus TaxID=3225 RepID=A0A8T0IEJ2_CERPU|nr:hypothetical protein KC19_4G210100 [Ceratodon purpureus]
MHFNENGVGSMDYMENRNGLSLELARSNCVAKFEHQAMHFSEALQATVSNEEDCNSLDGNNTSDSASSQGSSARMEGNNHECCRNDFGGRSRASSSSSTTMKAVENVVMQVLESVQASGYDEEVCNEFREHFARLPSRYTLNIDPHGHEDVLLHMELLMEARESEYATSCSSYGDPEAPTPQVHVRKVQLAGLGISGNAPSPAPSPRGGALRKQGLQIPKPAFGSGSNLVGLGLGGSPKLHKSEPGLGRSYSTPRLSHYGGSPLNCSETHHSIPRPAFGNFTNPLHVDDGDLGEHDDVFSSFGYEITIATTDRQGLLKYFTSALSDSHLQLNIKEAHVFSTTDGMALEVFVVEGWLGDEAEELRQAVLNALDEKSGGRSNRSDYSRLRAAAEAIQYEDWAVDFNLLEFGGKLGNGSTGSLFKGTYMSQDVAIKIMEIDECNGSGTESDTHRSAPASERLQIFKQEVSIMRLVRHKNVVQFIGACSKWPKLCIVTELMAGGSVRELLDNRMSGLEIASAIKLLRDAARGMDFLHKRGIVHRDMKAANLLIDEYDVVKVCDFGVARLKPTPSHPSEKSSFCSAEMTAETGTYRWMSPEVLEHKPYDHKADVYSFGITMWEVLTGDVPYAGLTPLQAAIGVVQRGLRPVIPPYVPEVLSILMQRCWHKDPNSRPEFNEVLRTLEMLVVTPPSSRRVVSRRRTTNTSFRSGIPQVNS